MCAFRPGRPGLRARGVDVKLNGSVTPENVGEMDRLYAIARQLDVPMHMDAS